jgi:hypothetical protein
MTADTYLERFYIIQEQARAAAAETNYYAAEAVRETFLRLRAEARELLCDRIGWSEEDFDRDVPDWEENPAVAARRLGRIGTYGGDPQELLVTLAKAKHQLGQLAAYLGGYAKAIEYDRDRELVAAKKGAAEATKDGKKKVGF